MGRSIPSSLSGANPWIHPMLVIPFIVACVAASIAIVVTLCASCHRKSSPQKPPSKYGPSSPRSNGSPRKEKSDEAAAAAAAVVEIPDEGRQQQPQSRPTADAKVVLDAATHGPILPSQTVTEQSSRRKLSMSLSMKLPEGLSKIRTGKKERHGKAAVEEETIWKKTIILGEKCRVPNEDGDEAAAAAAAAAACGEKGNWQRNYHPRTPRSLPVSRNNSFSNPDLVVPF